MKRINVVAAVINHGGKILCVQRGPNKYSYISNKYEFPGGKIEKGETPNESISREILEELHLKIDIIEDLKTVEHTYPDFQIKLHAILCSCPDHKIHLTEHIDYKWLKPSELDTLDWAEADIPIVEHLMKE